MQSSEEHVPSEEEVLLILQALDAEVTRREPWWVQVRHPDRAEYRSFRPELQNERRALLKWLGEPPVLIPPSSIGWTDPIGVSGGNGT